VLLIGFTFRDFFPAIVSQELASLNRNPQKATFTFPVPFYADVSGGIIHIRFSPFFSH